jgi:hypothetical protein
MHKHNGIIALILNNNAKCSRRREIRLSVRASEDKREELHSVRALNRNYILISWMAIAEDFQHRMADTMINPSSAFVLHEISPFIFMCRQDAGSHKSPIRPRPHKCVCVDNVVVRLEIHFRYHHQRAKRARDWNLTLVGLVSRRMPRRPIPTAFRIIVVHAAINMPDAHLSGINIQVTTH